MKNFKLLFAFFVFSNLVIASEDPVEIALITENKEEVASTTEDDKLPEIESVTENKEEVASTTEDDKLSEIELVTENKEEVASTTEDDKLSEIELVTENKEEVASTTEDDKKIAATWSETLKAPFVWFNEKLQSLDNSFNDLLLDSDANTYVAQAHNGLVTVIKFPFVRPVTTTVTAIVVYAAYMTCNELHDTKKANSKN